MSLKFFIKRSTAALLLALLMLSACTVALGQSGRIPSASSAPTASTPPAAPAALTPAPPAPAVAVTQASNQTPPAQPQQVITIVHQLSGWKLKTWLAFTDARVLEPSLINQFVYTNIVAGYVLSDGRSVVARLPEADAEMFNLPADFGFNTSKPGADASGLTLVRRDGARLAAKFIGVDGSTWLTLMEADGLRLPPSREAADSSLSVGQRVRLFAPLRAQKAQAAAANNGSVYMRVEEIKGTISDIARASTGSVTRLTVRAEGLSPQVVGGVVLNEAGETVGLVETSKAGEARVMPASIVKRAAERVLQRRASVPRPLLGVRGEAIAATTLKQLETTGWKLEEASKLLNNPQGVLLTKIAPNSPAALADLRAGDIVLRVGEGEVKNSEDLSYLLNEAGGGASVKFTVLRAMEAVPREIDIKLSEAFNLSMATGMSAAGFQSNANLYAPTVSAATTNVKRELERLAAEAAKIKSAVPVPPAATPQPPSIVADLDWLVVPSDKTPQRAGAPSVLLVNLVRSGSPAAKLGLRPGDVVVSVNGKTLTENEWPEKFLLQRAVDLSLVVMRGQDRITLIYSDK
ncbi:MAG: PDZ domain-containing protein [Pyrinomonadaceae bacterium]|nr:PDZ domain-containing protein [Pyrinomonadaceae bacterium]